MEHDTGKIDGFDIDSILDVAQRLMPSWPGAPVDVSYLPGGYSHRNYRLDFAGARYALRIVDGTPPRPGERRYLETAAAPDVVGYDPTTGHMLTRWIHGPILADSPPSPVEAGRYLAALHAEIPVGVRRYDYAVEIETTIADVAAPDAGVMARFESLAWSAAALCGCHNDLNPWNVIRTDSGFRTLDWEFAGDNDPVFDLVGLGLGFEWCEAQLAKCATAYAEVAASPLRLGGQRLAETVCAYRIREYAWAVGQIAAGNDRPEIREQAATMRRAVLRAG